MAYLRHWTTVASAVCKQSTTTGRLTPSVFSAQTCSRFSSLSSSARPVFSRPHIRSSTLSSIVYIPQSRTFLTHLRRQAQALKEQPVTPSASAIPKAKQPQPALQLNNLPYFVRRTGSNQLPVYLETKAGGTKQLTKIQKTEGDLDALRNDLARTLGVDLRSPEVSINRLTGHIIVKGWRKPEIVKFLQERNF